eukprot:m51a1_g13438 hypothetical protein (221) ;mRNA; f:1023-2115
MAAAASAAATSSLSVARPLGADPFPTESPSVREMWADVSKVVNTQREAYTALSEALAEQYRDLGELADATEHSVYSIKIEGHALDRELVESQKKLAALHAEREKALDKARQSWTHSRRQSDSTKIFSDVALCSARLAVQYRQDCDLRRAYVETRVPLLVARMNEALRSRAQAMRDVYVRMARSQQRWAQEQAPLANMLAASAESLPPTAPSPLPPPPSSS